MTKAHVNKLDNQHLSALLDGEQSLTDEVIAQQDAATLGRYALIGDVMRAESEDAFVFDISDSVAQALESEPVYADFTQSASQTCSHRRPRAPTTSWRLTGANQWRNLQLQQVLPCLPSLVFRPCHKVKTRRAMKFRCYKQHL